MCPSSWSFGTNFQTLIFCHGQLIALSPLLCTLLLQPLSVELGPGMLGNIFDGIQRPLTTIANMSGDCFIPRGVNVPALDAKKPWEFQPTGLKVCEIGFFWSCSFSYAYVQQGPY